MQCLEARDDLLYRQDVIQYSAPTGWVCQAVKQVSISHALLNKFSIAWVLRTAQSKLANCSHIKILTRFGNACYDAIESWTEVA
jgi:hypothetical protein